MAPHVAKPSQPGPRRVFEPCWRPHTRKRGGDLQVTSSARTRFVARLPVG